MGPTTSGHRPATTHSTDLQADLAKHRGGSTRSGPRQRALCPALSPFCDQMLLGAAAPRVDVNMPSLASRSACFAIFVACIGSLFHCLRVTALACGMLSMA
jgi:hypothetical protein